MHNSSPHRKFIMTPIASILRDTVTACNGIGNGIETQSLAEYVLQTTFLKMTGAQEQKLKCICWEMATNDYDYRYHYLKKDYGECSSYSDKNSIYRDLVEMIVKYDTTFSVAELFCDVDISSKENELIDIKITRTKNTQEEKKGRKLTDAELQALINGIKASWAKYGIGEEDRAKYSRIILFESMQELVEEIIGGTMVSQWEQHNYQNYIKNWKSLANDQFALGNALMDKDCQDLYTNVVYKHRNRCAHNLLSFQNNLPTLKTLVGEEYVYDNYYYRFSFLLLLDEIFTRLYKTYVKAIG